jgi:hypothetical protein
MSETPGLTGKKYDPDDVYKSAFGYIRPPYPGLILKSQTFGFSGVGALKSLRGSFRLGSKLNAEYTSPTKFKFTGKAGAIEEWQVPQEPTTSVQGSKNIIETQLNRGDRVQNVIEEVNLNNYKINIKGVIINEDDFNIYPEEAVRRLTEICEVPGSIEIQNWLINQYGINKIVIESFDFFEVKGFINSQAFELNCLSDEDFDLEVSDEPERL